MQAQEPQPPSSTTCGMPDDPMQHREKQDDEIDEQRQSRDESIPETADDSTQGSCLGSSAQEPTSTDKQWIVKRFWNEEVSVVVDFDTCRDHLALERTFLAYLRTGVVTAIMGTLVAQLFTLQQSDSGFGYRMVGKPLASVCYGFSICTTLLGACRVWRIQHAMLWGKTISGGFEIMTVAIGFLALVVVFFSFLIVLDIVKESGH